jgi:hypothetical protein
MDLISLLIAVLILVIIAWVAKYVIDSFFPEPIRMVALIVVGILLLLIVLRWFVGPVTVPWPAHVR